ncbi:unnamed protein product [Parajaminaea phylloscopi]
MGNQSSKSSSSAGPVIVAEALDALPRYGDICTVLGGVNAAEPMLLKATSGVGIGKFSLKDCKVEGGKTLIKSETKATRKRTTTTITSGTGQQLLKVEGTHECVAFRRGCIVGPNGIPGYENNSELLSPNGLHNPVYAATSGSGTAGVSSASSSSLSTDGTGRKKAAAGDIAFAARALDVSFFSWGIELRNLSPHGRGRTIAIWVEENHAMGTVDFRYEDTVVARVSATPNASILWRDEKYYVGKSAHAVVVAPGMDWVLVSTIAFLMISRKADHDAGLSTRAGDLALLKGLFEDETGDPDALRRSTSSIGTSTRSSSGYSAGGGGYKKASSGAPPAFAPLPSSGGVVKRGDAREIIIEE